MYRVSTLTTPAEKQLETPNTEPKTAKPMASYTDDDLQNLIERVGTLGVYL